MIQILYYSKLESYTKLTNRVMLIIIRNHNYILLYFLMTDRAAIKEEIARVK